MLKIDNREKCKEKLKSILGEKNVLFENLLIGDFEIIINDVSQLIIERKTIADFEASIIDGRYKEQKARLLSHLRPENIMYIIEGNICSYKKINIISAIISTCVRDKVAVLNTQTCDETVQVIVEAYKKMTRPDWNCATNYSQVLATSSISLTKKNNLNEKTFFIASISCVPGISTNKASHLYDKFHSINNLIEAIKTSNNPKCFVQEIALSNRKMGKVGLTLYKYLGLETSLEN